MSIDVVDLRNFYSQSLGIVARRFVGRGIRKRFADIALFFLFGDIDFCLVNGCGRRFFPDGVDVFRLVSDVGDIDVEESEADFVELGLDVFLNRFEEALALAQEHASRVEAAAKAAAPQAGQKQDESTSEQLTAEQKSEIERLISEVEAEIQEMNKEQKHADPAGRTLSWEAANEKEKGKT